MPDGTRKRRFSRNQARRRWYAKNRAARFFRRFGLTSAPQLPCVFGNGGGMRLALP